MFSTWNKTTNLLWSQSNKIGLFTCDKLLHLCLSEESRDMAAQRQLRLRERDGSCVNANVSPHTRFPRQKMNVFNSSWEIFYLGKKISNRFLKVKFSRRIIRQVSCGVNGFPDSTSTGYALSNSCRKVSIGEPKWALRPPWTILIYPSRNRSFCFFQFSAGLIQ